VLDVGHGADGQHGWECFAGHWSQKKSPA